MAYLTLFCRKFPKNSRKKSQRSGRGGGSSRLGQNPNFYRKFVLHASLTNNNKIIIISSSSQDFKPLFHVADFFPTFSALVKQVTWRKDRTLVGSFYMMLQFMKSDSILRNEWITHQTTNSSRALQIPHMDGVNQLPALISQANEGARNAVHIHRDYDRDGHAYRRGPWKVGGLFFGFTFLSIDYCGSPLPAFLLYTCVQWDKI